MNPILKNSIAVIAGCIVGSIVNMVIVMISGSIIPPPEGIDITSKESLQATMHLFQPKHFIFPFLAHALGTLIGAMVAARVAATHKLKIALGIGGFFLLGGLANALILPSPTWFIALDLAIAYLPMAYLGGKILEKRSH